jgi:antirestriction protein ArdC
MIIRRFPSYPSQRPSSRADSQHWTSKRLARESILEAAPCGSAFYSKEELCAEMGAAYPCAEAGIKRGHRESAYVAGWLRKWQARHFFNNHQDDLM